jgi:hypothetical protein
VSPGDMYIPKYIRARSRLSKPESRSEALLRDDIGAAQRDEVPRPEREDHDEGRDVHMPLH